MKNPIVALMLAALLAACSPRVTVEAPKESIHMIVDVNIKHELLVKIDKDVEKLIDEKDDIF